MCIYVDIIVKVNSSNSYKILAASILNVKTGRGSYTIQFRKLHFDPVQQQYEYPPVDADHLPDSGHFSLVMHFERIMNSSLLRVKTLFFVTQTSNSEQTIS